jgi:chromosome segregation ATPase
VHSADTARVGLAQTRLALQKRLDAAEQGRTSMQKELDDATAVDDQLSKQLQTLGQDSQSLLAVNGTLKDALESSRRRLDELRRARAAADSRAALYRDLALRFKRTVDAGDLATVLR